MNNISNLNECTSCCSCSCVCPTKAISIDESGFFYKPIVDTKKCIDCSLCLSACPLTRSKTNNKIISAYGGWSKLDDVVLQSSSGGAYHELAKLIVEEGGVAFGAVFSDDNRKVIIDNSDNVSLNKLQKSKYVESVLFDAYKVVEDYLDKNRTVLFCGTPCQIAGIKSCIPESKQEKLVTIDFACGGLPSHKIYNDYIEHLEKKYKSKIISVDFRPKTYGWKHYAILVRFKNGKIYSRLLGEDYFLRLFLNGQYSIRLNCLNCYFSDNHYSDVTISDFWKHKQLSNLQNDNGISLILCNTEKGMKLVEKIKPFFEWKQIDVNKLSYNNVNQSSAENKIKKHIEFLEFYEKNGFILTCKKYFPNSIVKRIRCRFTAIKYKRRKRCIRKK